MLFFSVCAILLKIISDRDKDYCRYLHSVTCAYRMRKGMVIVMSVQESGEMYLETILILSRDNKNVRSVDVGEYMGYSKPSVCRAVGILKNGGFINMDKNGYLTLTDAGLELAQKIYERHTVLSALLERIGVSHDTAVADACKIEHDISEETFSALCAHAKKII